MTKLPKINEIPVTLKSPEKSSETPDSIELMKLTEQQQQAQTQVKPWKSKCFVPKQDTFEELKRCRYLRRSNKQQEKEEIDLDISFLRNEFRSKVKDNEQKQPTLSSVYNVKRSTKTDSAETIKEASKLRENNNNLVPAIQPYNPHLEQKSLRRDKMEPLLVQFADKCSLGQYSPSYNYIRVTGFKTKPKVNKLYKEIHEAAENANVDLASVSRNVKLSRSSLKRQHLFEKGSQKWRFLSGLVRSGWLFSKKGRSLKLMESQKRKRMLAENVGVPALISRAKKNHLQDEKSQDSYVRRRLAKNKLPTLNIDSPSK